MGTRQMWILPDGKSHRVAGANGEAKDAARSEKVCYDESESELQGWDMTSLTIEHINFFCFITIMAELSVLFFFVGWQHRYETFGDFTVFGLLGMVGSVFAILSIVGMFSYCSGEDT